MKQILLTLAIAATAALATSSCATGPVGMQPRGDVEELEREAPVTPTPNVGQHEAGRNAVRYANDGGYHHGRYGYGGPYGYGVGRYGHGSIHGY